MFKINNKFKRCVLIFYMEIIKHRINCISDIDSEFGAEIDVRDNNGKIVLSHDYPDNTSETLSNFLKHFPKNRLLQLMLKVVV